MKMVIHKNFVKDYLTSKPFRNGSVIVEEAIKNLMNNAPTQEFYGSIVNGCLVAESWRYTEKFRPDNEHFYGIIKISGSFDIKPIVRNSKMGIGDMFNTPEQLYLAELDFYMVEKNTSEWNGYDLKAEVVSGNFKKKKTINRFNYLEYGTGELIEIVGENTTWHKGELTESYKLDKAYLTDVVYYDLNEMISELVKSKPPILPSGGSDKPHLGVGIVEEVVQKHNLSKKEIGRAIEYTFNEIQKLLKLNLEYEYR